jgi:hypothetical protein
MYYIAVYTLSQGTWPPGPARKKLEATAPAARGETLRCPGTKEGAPAEPPVLSLAQTLPSV